MQNHWLHHQSRNQYETVKLSNTETAARTSNRRKGPAACHRLVAGAFELQPEPPLPLLPWREPRL
jgi:hypothetical protein